MMPLIRQLSNYPLGLGRKMQLQTELPICDTLTRWQQRYAPLARPDAPPCMSGSALPIGGRPLITSYSPCRRPLGGLVDRGGHLPRRGHQRRQGALGAQDWMPC